MRLPLSIIDTPSVRLAAKLESAHATATAHVIFDAPRFGQKIVFSSSA
jgi:hypothetical protein